MRSSVALFVLVVLVVALASVSAFASPGSPLTVDGGWADFHWDGTSFPVDAYPSYSLVATGPVTVQVTDSYDSGDIFEVWVDNILALTTNSVPKGYTNNVSGDAAWADINFSKGSFVLGAGSYGIDIKTIAGYTGGGAYIQARTNAVPEPATLLGFGLPMLMIGLGKLRQLRK